MQDSKVTVGMLTPTEQKVYQLNGIGKQTKEIADILKSSYETAKSHMKNIKAKLGLQKDKEVTAHFWCSLVGQDFDEMKKRIISSCLILSLLMYIPFEFDRMRETRTYNSKARRSLLVRRNDYAA